VDVFDQRRSKNDRYFDDATVETAMRSSIDYKYTTINNFDEICGQQTRYARQYWDDDDKYNANGSLTTLTLRSATTTTTLSLITRHGASLDNIHVLQTESTIPVVSLRSTV
jgi:hypothetical protein